MKKLLFIVAILLSNLLQAQVTDNLVAYYPFSGHSWDVVSGFDAINNSATLTANNGCSNSAYQFSGWDNNQLLEINI